MKCVFPWSFLVLAVMAACTLRANPDQGAVGDARPAEVIFAEMENRMLKASVISGRFTVTASGAYSAALKGALEMSHGAETDLQAAGSFGDDSVKVFLRSDGRIMEGGNADRRFHEHTPAGLTEALLLGFTRMGILHNLARLTGGASPDRADGGVRDWVEVRKVQFGPDTGHEGLTSGVTCLSFEIYVAGEQAAEATLWLDPDSGLPVRRRQVVTFPGGQMMVTESYDLTMRSPSPTGGLGSMQIHYLEIVTNDVEAVCAAYAVAFGVQFGMPDTGLGNARTAGLPGGGLVGVRAPLRETEDPVVRPYWLVGDIESAVAKVLEAGGEIAHPPLEIPGHGTFAIYFLGGNQHGLWQR